MAIQVKVGTPNRINTSIKRVQLDNLNVEELKNIDASGGLENGYTLVYDSVLEKWVPQAVAGVSNIDGGTF